MELLKITVKLESGLVVGVCEDIFDRKTTLERIFLLDMLPGIKEFLDGVEIECKKLRT